MPNKRPRDEAEAERDEALSSSSGKKKAKLVVWNRSVEAARRKEDGIDMLVSAPRSPKELPSSSSSSDARPAAGPAAWSDDEVSALYAAHASVPLQTADFWASVAQRMAQWALGEGKALGLTAVRSARECLDQWTSVSFIFSHASRDWLS
jgi:hypothetical protein